MEVLTEMEMNKPKILTKCKSIDFDDIPECQDFSNEYFYESAQNISCNR